MHHRECDGVRAEREAADRLKVEVVRGVEQHAAGQRCDPPGEQYPPKIDVPGGPLA